ncbi:IS66 family insertion sequence element accessory protein TnpA [Dysosmobacter welbionis]
MEWAQLVSECRSSELTCREWCAQHRITERRYHYWQKRVFDRAILQRETAAVSTSGNDYGP